MQQLTLSWKIVEGVACAASLTNNIFLVIKSIWNFSFGILAAALFALVFHKSKLYADMSLQMVYIAMNIYGWYLWSRDGAQSHQLRNIIIANRWQLLQAFIAILIGTAIISTLLHFFTDSTTIFLDGSTTTMSLVAMWMTNKKWLQNWILWIIMNCVSLYMYTIKGLYYTTILYAVFVIICIGGFYRWWQHYKKHQQELNPTPALR